MAKKRKKVGLALGGGAMRGLIHVGVIKALRENNIPIDYIAGCSIGSWVGAHYAAYEDVEALEELLERKKFKALTSFVDITLRQGVIRGVVLEKLVQKTLGYKDFSDLSIPLAVVATDLSTGKEVDIKDGDLISAIRASMAIPVMYKPIEREGKLLIDGGICNPVPDNIVKKMGADIVISVSLDNYNYEKIFKGTKLTYANIASRAFSIIYKNLSLSCMNDSDFIIKPENDLVGFKGWKRFFLNKIDKKFIKLGYKDTMKIIPDIKKLL